MLCAHAVLKRAAGAWWGHLLLDASEQGNVQLKDTINLSSACTTNTTSVSFTHGAGKITALRDHKFPLLLGSFLFLLKQWPNFQTRREQW